MPIVMSKNLPAAGKGGADGVATKTFLTEHGLAERQARSVKTIRNERVLGRGVPFIKIGRLVRYRLSDVEAWEQAHLRTSTSDVGGDNG